MHKAIGLPTSRRVGLWATGWRARPRPGRLAGGRLELAQLGGRELCGLAGGPQGVPEAPQSPHSCSRIMLCLPEVGPGG